MFTLDKSDTLMVSGGSALVAGDERAYSDQFWSSFVQAAGTGSGFIASPVIAVGMVGYSVAYYGIYTPLSCLVNGAYSIVSYPFRSA